MGRYHLREYLDRNTPGRRQAFRTWYCDRLASTLGRSFQYVPAAVSPLV
jgi:hypothetical protein